MLLVVHGAVLAASGGLWLFLETHDPAVPSCWSSLLPSNSRWTTLKYCRIHQKKIEGLDHYCEWLNVSIGRSNYVPFVLLLCLGLTQVTSEVLGTAATEDRSFYR